MNSHTIANKPIVFIDIDGVLNPFAEPRFLKPFGFKRHRIIDDESWQKYTMWLNPQHKDWLMSLIDIADLAWSTTWNKQANSKIGWRIGLPELPVAEVTIVTHDAAGVKLKCPLWWKPGGILNLAQNRRFIWLDDDHDQCMKTGNSERDYFRLTCKNKYQLIHVNPQYGLQPHHINDIRKTIESLK